MLCNTRTENGGKFGVHPTSTENGPFSGVIFQPSIRAPRRPSDGPPALRRTNTRPDRWKPATDALGALPGQIRRENVRPWPRNSETDEKSAGARRGRNTAKGGEKRRARILANARNVRANGCRRGYKNKRSDKLRRPRGPDLEPLRPSFNTKTGNGYFDILRPRRSYTGQALVSVERSSSRSLSRLQAGPA